MEQKEKAVRAWESILAILVLNQQTSWSDLTEHLTKGRVPRPHRVAAQFILLGSGYATQNLEPDGDWGNESKKSSRDLYIVVHGI